MTNDQKTSFLTYYIRSLAERTRVEKRGTKFGFDWVIYNLGLAADRTPLRLPFLRGGPDEISKTKTEAEFGVDFAFLSSDRRELFVFVLKDEVLNNKNWAAHNFDVDLRMAAAPDLGSADTSSVEKVCVILAYNKDEDQTGVELFERLTAALGTKVGDKATLVFDRWNLTTITEMVRDTLLTPSLLPQAFFSQFSYLCSQVGDFQHGTDEWAGQLVPDWRRFLSELLKDNPDERRIILVPVALIILRESCTGNPAAETGWIDLVEWAMLAVLQVHQSTKEDAVRLIIEQMWFELYIRELDRYYQAHAASLAVTSSLEKHVAGGFVDAVASAVTAHWHLARLGIFAAALSEMLPRESESDLTNRETALNAVANWIVGLTRANASAKRPLLDIHHIELFLTWRALWQVGRDDDICNWLFDLQNRLVTRRTGRGDLPFIDGHNSLDAVFEYVATNTRPREFCDQSSVFLTCLLELCFSLPDEQRDLLQKLVYQRLVLGNQDSGTRMDGCEPIDLMLWVPPPDWGERIFQKSLADEGACITVDFERMYGATDATVAGLAERMAKFVEVTRRQLSNEIPNRCIPSRILLACVKYASPLPPEFWRRSIFGEVATSGSEEAREKTE